MFDLKLKTKEKKMKKKIEVRPLAMRLMFKTFSSFDFLKKTLIHN